MSYQATQADIDANVAALRQGAATWNNYRSKLEESNPDWKPVFDGADLSNVKGGEPGCGFRGGANLRGASLVGVRGDNVNLNYCDVRDARIENSNLSGLQAKLTDFTGSTITKSDLSGGDFRATTLDDSKIKDSNFSGSDMSGAHVWRSRVSNNDFSKAKVGGFDAGYSGNNFDGATSRYAQDNNPFPRGTAEHEKYRQENPPQEEKNDPVKLENSNLSGNKLTNAQIPEISLQGSIVRPNNSVDGSNLSGAKLNGADASRVDFTKAQADGLNARGANLTGTQMTQAQQNALDGGKAGQDNMDPQQRAEQKANTPVENFSAEDRDPKKDFSAAANPSAQQAPANQPAATTSEPRAEQGPQAAAMKQDNPDAPDQPPIPGPDSKASGTLSTPEPSAAPAAEAPAATSKEPEPAAAPAPAAPGK